ncbi:hypothetical protein Hsw_PA0066 (plasmid) [Hymenobacter swuensis DY53]|uniref:Uncharacterized protein n=1 Tax=Hymenobacter swuensis DY53 TaxID=1227739 RepID=W8EQG0_9BACT|nr:hypothetical protein Hsw_PA0066 [Hymenobacter swuensis DY53]
MAWKMSLRMGIHFYETDWLQIYVQPVGFANAFAIISLEVV